MGLIRRCVGQWWLPDNPEQKVGGVLEIDRATGLQLELTDHLLTFGASGEPIPVVLGAADGRRITLLEVNPANGGHTVWAELHTTFEVARPRVAMVGIHLEDAAEALFNGLEVEMTGLTAFAGQTGLKWEYTATQDSDERTKFTISWTDPIETQPTDQLEMTVGLHWKLTSNPGPQLSAERRRYQADEVVAVRAETETPQPWTIFLDPIRAVQDLVTIATQMPSRITSRALHVNAEPLPHTIDLYFRGPSDSTDEPQEFDASNVIFTLDTLDFSTVIDRWFRLRKKVGLPVDVLLGLDYQPIRYYDVLLFNAAAAAEGFHAGLYPTSTAVDPAEHKALKKTVSRLLRGLGKGGARKTTEGALQNIQVALRDKVLGILDGVANSKQREWVMNQIGENRPGLNERYVELAGTADPEAVIALLTHVDTWAGWLRDARNAVGHVNTGQLQAKIPDKALYRLQYITRALLHLVLIDQLGISAEVQRESVQELWSFSAAKFRDAVRDATLQQT